MTRIDWERVNLDLSLIGIALSTSMFAPIGTLPILGGYDGFITDWVHGLWAVLTFFACAIWVKIISDRIASGLRTRYVKD